MTHCPARMFTLRTEIFRRFLVELSLELQISLDMTSILAKSGQLPVTWNRWMASPVFKYRASNWNFQSIQWEDKVLCWDANWDTNLLGQWSEKEIRVSSFNHWFASWNTTRFSSSHISRIRFRGCLVLAFSTVQVERSLIDWFMLPFLHGFNLI